MTKEECEIETSNAIMEMRNQIAELTQAKELLTKWVELFRPKGGNILPTPIQVETEQFLNGGKK